MLGSLVDALGNPIDGKGEIKTKLTAPIEVVAPGVIMRQSVDQPVQIGLKSIDAQGAHWSGSENEVLETEQTGKTAVVLTVPSSISKMQA